jgi:hypothetical protein
LAEQHQAGGVGGEADPYHSTMKALALAALAFVPALGYLEAAAVPLVGGRLRRRAGSRYAGLRILARD